MAEFWESIFKNNDKMWGETPTDNAKHVLNILEKHNVKSLLIPGFGYGRNAKIFYDKGINVTGIEISKTAIKRARKYFENTTIIHHGSVTNMPFDSILYDAIYCYSLIHLLNEADRLKLIKDCYTQLKPSGIMIFVALSINDKRFGLGEKICENTYFSPNGLNLYFYNEDSVKEEFGRYNLLTAKEINEPVINPNEKHWMIMCKK
ncbi:methyltransferase [Tamlana sedimentorum]|uniref:Methyltransferase n=1 Tax=Neotamlana sedimentorum TaxID=1435349 RepID=A0A0D7WAG7_9FLAO|nr:class I SAM-dependent methyltransferase [Tamlana sedimentorum]KJD36160.1 methyltransferase [Tamlana sedimentorum]